MARKKRSFIRELIHIVATMVAWLMGFALFILGIIHGSRGDYANGAYTLILAHILVTNAEQAMKDDLEEDAKEVGS